MRRVVILLPPDPTEENGSLISDPILQQVADPIDQQYSEDLAVTSLTESGALTPELPQRLTRRRCCVPSTTGGSEGRRILRGLLGRWLDDQLVSGPKKRSQDQAHRSTRPPGLRDPHTRP